MEGKELPYQDFKVNIKLLLSALWASVMFLYIYGDYFELYVPGKVEGLLNGQNLLNTPYRLLTATLVLTVPSLMICLSMITKPKWNRILNILFGTLLTLLTLVVGILSFTEWRLFYVLLSVLESFVTAMIVWRAWQWPKENNLGIQIFDKKSTIADD